MADRQHAAELVVRATQLAQNLPHDYELREPKARLIARLEAERHRPWYRKRAAKLTALAGGVVLVAGVLATGVTLGWFGSTTVTETTASQTNADNTVTTRYDEPNANQQAETPDYGREQLLAELPDQSKLLQKGNRIVLLATNQETELLRLGTNEHTGAVTKDDVVLLFVGGDSSREGERIYKFNSTSRTLQILPTGGNVMNVAVWKPDRTYVVLTLLSRTERQSEGGAGQELVLTTLAYEWETLTPTVLDTAQGAPGQMQANGKWLVSTAGNEVRVRNSIDGEWRLLTQEMNDAIEPGQRYVAGNNLYFLTGRPYDFMNPELKEMPDAPRVQQLDLLTGELRETLPDVPGEQNVIGAWFGQEMKLAFDLLITNFRPSGRSADALGRMQQLGQFTLYGLDSRGIHVLYQGESTRQEAFYAFWNDGKTLVRTQSQNPERPGLTLIYDEQQQKFVSGPLPANHPLAQGKAVRQ